MEWEPDDRDKVMAYALEKTAICPMCGTESWKWAEDPQAYEAVAESCPGCAAKDVARTNMGDAASSPGVSITLIPHAVSKARRSVPARRPKSARELAGKGKRAAPKRKR